MVVNLICLAKINGGCGVPAYAIGQVCAVDDKVAAALYDCIGGAADEKVVGACIIDGGAEYGFAACQNDRCRHLTFPCPGVVVDETI